MEHSQDQVEGFKQRWSRLVDQLERRAIVPFVGAGISMQSKCLDDGDFKPKVWWMQEQLAQSLVRKAVTGVIDPVQQKENLRRLHGQLGLPPEIGLQPRRVSEDASAKPDAKKPDEVFTAKTAKKLMKARPEVRFERIAEVHSWWCGSRGTCEAIGISHFADMSTLPAHRWIARLTREGLIREIISTNYDTCLEKAYRNTLPPSRRDRGDVPVVIRTLDEYREHGAARDDAEGCPIPRLYKINGCAAQYGEHLDGVPLKVRLTPVQQRVIDSIILTEHQLHNFQRQAWKQELFRDRARSRALLFSGFGSDEPQVRHTLLQLAHEFGVGRDVEMIKPDQCWSRNNAPFVAGYSATLAYPQAQVLREYAYQHTRDPLGRTPVDLVDMTRANVFTGLDAGFFKAKDLAVAPEDPDITGKISADLFWKRLYQSVFLRLVKHHCRRGSSFYGWLTDVTASPQRSVDRLLAWLGCGDEEHPWGRCPWLVEEMNEKGASISRFSRWLMALAGERPAWRSRRDGRFDESSFKHDFQRDRYLSLRDDPLLALATLYALMLLAGGDHADEKKLKKLVEPGPEGLWVTLEGDPELAVVLTVNGVRPGRWPDQGTLESGCVRQLVVPSLKSGSLRDALQGSTEAGGARSVPVYRLSARVLVERCAPEAPPDLARRWLRRVSAESREPRRSDTVRLRPPDDSDGGNS